MAKRDEPPKRESLSEATFERVLARAAELDEHANARVSVDRAREIALELGVTPAGWEAALAEQERSPRVANGRSVPAWSLPRNAALALGSLGIGYATGTAKLLGNAWHRILPLGGLAVLVTVSLGLIWANRRKGSPRRLQVDLAAWWLPYAAGYAVAYPRLVGDVSGIIILFWAGAAIIGASAMTLRAPGQQGGASSPEPTV